MSAFSHVDTAADGGRLVDMLEESARGLAAMKHYMAVAHSLRLPQRPVLDIGSGAGHDLSVLEQIGLPAVGIEPSSMMLSASSRRVTSVLVQGTGESLPFADGSFAGCWIERVLMHVLDPAAVLREAVRCVEPGGLLTIFEPDWSSLAVNGTPVPVEWVSMARHPGIGAAVGDLLRDAECRVRDRVEERSWWDFDTFARVTNLARAASQDSRVEQWAAEQRHLAGAGKFAAEIKKILWVANTPEARG